MICKYCGKRMMKSYTVCEHCGESQGELQNMAGMLERIMESDTVTSGVVGEVKTKSIPSSAYDDKTSMALENKISELEKEISRLEKDNLTLTKLNKNVRGLSSCFKYLMIAWIFVVIICLIMTIVVAKTKKDSKSLKSKMESMEAQYSELSGDIMRYDQDSQKRDDMLKNRLISLEDGGNAQEEQNAITENESSVIVEENKHDDANLENEEVNDKISEEKVTTTKSSESSSENKNISLNENNDSGDKTDAVNGGDEQSQEIGAAEIESAGDNSEDSNNQPEE